MPRLYLTTALAQLEQKELPLAVQTVFQQLEDQINSGPSIVSLTDNQRQLPQGMQPGDIVFDIAGGVLKIGVWNGATIIY